MKINFYGDSIFKYKYKRNPKYWTIDELHDLYLRSLDRHYKRRLEQSKCTNEIVKNIPISDTKYINQKSHFVYAITNKGEILTYSFSYYDNLKNYGVSKNILEFSKDIVQGRLEKINFMTSNDIAFELGQKYYEIEKLQSSLHYKVKQVLWDVVENKLRKYFKDSNTYPSDIFIMKISNKKYYVYLDEKSNRAYMKFNLGDEYVDEIIEIS